MSRFRAFLVLGVCAATAGAAAGAVIRGNVIARVGDPIGANTISLVGNPFVDSTGRVGFLIGESNNTRGIWYDTGPIFNSADLLPDVATGGEDSIGIGDGGAFIYSPTYNGDDAVVTQDGLLMTEGIQPPGRPAGEFTSFSSRPNMLADGTAVWVAGRANTLGGSSVGRMLYRCADTTDVNSSTIVIQTGDVIGGLAAITASGVGFTYDFSEDGSHHIHRLILSTGSTTNDDVMYVDGAIVAREGSPAIGGDNYATFNALSINNSGDYVFSSNTSGATTSDEILVYNDAVLFREGNVIDGVTLGAVVDVAHINNRGWISFIWDSSLTETVFAVNPTIDPQAAVAVLSVGDELDTDGDGDGDFTITDFNVSMSIAADNGFANNGYFYANADVTPVGGGASAEAMIRVNILQGCPGDVDFNLAVDISDLAQLLANFGVQSGAGPTEGDSDGDGDVDLEDLSRLLSSFGSTC